MGYEMFICFLVPVFANRNEFIFDGRRERKKGKYTIQFHLKEK